MIFHLTNSIRVPAHYVVCGAKNTAKCVWPYYYYCYFFYHKIHKTYTLNTRRYVGDRAYRPPPQKHAPDRHYESPNRVRRGPPPRGKVITATAVTRDESRTPRPTTVISAVVLRQRRFAPVKHNIIFGYINVRPKSRKTQSIIYTPTRGSVIVGRFADYPYNKPPHS